MFQKEHVDINAIGREIDATMTTLQTMYLGHNFGEGSKCSREFLKNVYGDELKYKDENDNVVGVHKLLFPKSSYVGTLEAWNWAKLLQLIFWLS